MKKSLLIMAMAAFAVQASAQFTVSVSVDIDNDSRSRLINNGGKYDDSRLNNLSSDWQITPSVGYELDEWEVGLELGLSHYAFTTRNYTTGDLDKDVTFGVYPSVYGRRFFPVTDRFKLFAECSLGMGYLKDTDAIGDYSKSVSVYLSMYPGMTYELTDHFAIEAFFSYPELDLGFVKTSYYDTDGILVGDGSSRSYFTLTPLDGFMDLVNRIQFGISYAF